MSPLWLLLFIDVALPLMPVSSHMKIHILPIKIDFLALRQTIGLKCA